MLTDAHCHPFNLVEHFPAAEDERRQLGVICAANATSLEEFLYCEQLNNSDVQELRILPRSTATKVAWSFTEEEEKNRLKLRADQPVSISPCTPWLNILPCFGVHPQMPVVMNNAVQDSLAVLKTLAAEGRLAAVGETGFDLYNEAFRETEKVQDDLFAVHLETALRFDLPLVLHVRRAMHKIFAFSTELKKCRAVIFHSWPGTLGEGEALIRRGINVFFSFGNIILLNHREAIRCCAMFPLDRLLTETDAPFQPQRGKKFSSYADLRLIIQAMAALRGEGISPEKMESIIEDNFGRAFKH